MGIDITRLDSNAVFRGISSDATSELAAAFHSARVCSGEVVLRRGDPSSALHLVLEGRVRTTATGATGMRIREYVDGDLILDDAFLTGLPRAMTAKAVRDTLLASLTWRDIRCVAQHHADAILELLQRYAAAVHDDGEHTRMPEPRTFAVIPSGRPALAERFVDGLESALLPMGAVVRVSPKQQPESVSVVANDGDRNRFVLYEADETETGWTRACLANADVVLVLADAADDSRSECAAPVVPNSRSASPAERHLIVLHEHGDIPPTATRRSLENRYVDRHHHVRVNSKLADTERLVRTLLGRAVCVVLSGGGARAFAHIGVLRAIMESGIPVDAIGGASMGAVVAAQFAMGLSADEVADANRRAWSNWRLAQLSTAGAAIFSDGKLVRILDGLFGQTNIEDLWIPFFCVSTNLTRADLMIHWDGALATALRASVMPPGLGPPVRYRGELLADGGLLDMLPVHAMRQFCTGFVLAIDVGIEKELAISSEQRGRWRRWPTVPSAMQGYPNVVDILGRAAMLSSAHALDRAKHMADYYLHPPVDGFGMFDWKSLDALVESGYAYARNELGRSGAIGLRTGIARG